MQDSSPPRSLRIAAWAVLAVPLVVDPFGLDTLSLKQLLLALTGGVALVLEGVGLMRRGGQGLLPTPPELLLAALAIWATASLGWAYSPSLGWLGVAMLVALPGAVRAVRASVIRPEQLRGWVVALVLVGLAVVVVDGLAILVRQSSLALEERKYASSIFVHNNLASTWAVMLVPLAASLALGKRWRLLFAIACLVLLAYLVLLRSRAGLAAALAGLAVLLLLRLLRRRFAAPDRRWALALGAVVLAGALVPFADRARGLAKDGFYQVVSVLERFDVGTKGDALFRPNVWRRTLALAAESPLLGAGAGNFTVAYAPYEMGQADIPHAHNDALQILAELGLPGLVLFLALLACVAWQLLTVLARQRGDPASYALASGLTASVFVFVLVGLFEVPFALGATAATLVVVLGLVGSLARAPRRQAIAGRWLLAPALLLGGLGCLTVAAIRLPGSAWHAQAQSLWEQGDLPGAQRVLERMARLGLGAHLPHQMLGQLAWARGDWVGALNHYRAARRIWPGGAELLLREGEALLALGQDGEALKAFRAALGSSPNDPATIIALVRSLERAGELDEAIARSEFLVQSDHVVSLDVVSTLARLWGRRAAGALEGQARTEAMVGARHFYAQLLQDGGPARWEEWDREFKHLTHQLQQLPGAPDSWFDVYRQFLTTGGWSMPDTARWTSMDVDGQPLFPGWDEKAGPPFPRAMR